MHVEAIRRLIRPSTAARVFYGPKKQTLPASNQAIQGRKALERWIGSLSTKYSAEGNTKHLKVELCDIYNLIIASSFFGAYAVACESGCKL